MTLPLDTRPSGGVEFKTCLVTAGGRAKPKELRRAGWSGLHPATSLRTSRFA